MTYPEADVIAELVAGAQKIVVVQADNPDGDSLGSALGLEHILGDLGKDVVLYCGVDVPGYLRYLTGWDRIVGELPNQFDLSIIVDASTNSLLEKLIQSGGQAKLAAKPCVVLDHHGSVENVITYASVMINDPGRSSAGELIYAVAKQLAWPVSVPAMEALMTCILGDTQGLTNQLATAETYRVMAEMIEAGVDRPRLEELRREYSKMPRDIFKYKADLIRHTEFSDDGKVASVVISQSEINTYSPLYNPGPLIQGDILQTSGVLVAIVLKQYADGRVTGAIRCNPTAGIGAELATKMGGGGHQFASGFKDTTGRPFNEIKSECLRYANELLSNLDKGTAHETLQHTY